MNQALQIVFCLLLPISALAGQFAMTRVSEVQDFFKKKDKMILTFVGYSGAEYENKIRMLKIAEEVLSQYDPKTTLVNIGATQDGIGAVYALAKKMGFETSGIVSSQALQDLKEKPPEVDHVFFIEDETWGGYLPHSLQLSATSAATVSVSDVIVGIGGGSVARDELFEAQKKGKTLRFFTADMNHEVAIAKAKKKGDPAPEDFRGSAHIEWFLSLDHSLRRLMHSCRGLRKISRKDEE